MKVNVIGKLRVDVPNDSGGRIVGTSIYYLSSITGNGVGQRGMKKFISDDVLDYNDVVIGVNNFDIDLEGKVLGIINEK